MRARFRLTERRAGFTLIELLIVVAIIAILAAIAVPNFLEAQVRSKVARVKNDMRTIAVAMESYFIEYNSYSLDWDSGGYGGSYNSEWRTYAALTTPVAYITSIPRDPFSDHGKSMLNLNAAKKDNFFQYAAPDRRYYSNMISIRPGWAAHGVKYAMSTPGPDLKDDELWANIYTDLMYDRMYDPSNGTKSKGDLARTNTGPFPE